MKKNILSAILLTGGTMLLLVVVYPLIVWGFAQFSPNSGKGELVRHNGKAYYVNIGQAFVSDKYFSSRPSAVDYNAAGSGASNKAVTNPEYLAQVSQRIDEFMAKNPTVKKEDIPVDLVTASGSGLDPNYSVQAALVQVARIAASRNLSENVVTQLIHNQIESPLLGIFGPEKVNVLRLNIALDQIK